MTDGQAELAKELRYTATIHGAKWTARQYLPDLTTVLADQQPSLPTEVLESWPDTLSIEGSGLRVPQAGALHALLGYWTTDPRQPATIVMPTGTGKTDTMVAALVAVRAPRLLVLVPSDALRDQLAIKFERLEVIRALSLVSDSALCPVVGRLNGALVDAADSDRLADTCNVVISTVAALSQGTPEVRVGFLARFSHLFIDEAHHVAAASWKRIRDEFATKSVVQFTATPYRRDGAHLGGALVYAFPLREAQRQGFFSKIRYQSVIDPVDPDRSIALRALEHLKEDLESGYDHLLMARTASIKRAEEVIKIYRDLAPEYEPVLAHHQLGKGKLTASLEDLGSRKSRVLVCVDMFGEGFDFPQLKVAALHDQHRSLGVTLQFVGRFARSGDLDIGPATVVSARSEVRHDESLRRLYAQDADWDTIIEDLSRGAMEEQGELDEFTRAFGHLPDQFSIHALTPAMSTVVFKPSTSTWRPDRVVDIFSESEIRTFPIPTNERDHVLWFVLETHTPARWGDSSGTETVAFHLYVVYWDEANQLLYINSSDNDSVHEKLAQAISGDDDLKPVTGDSVYRVFHEVVRLTPTNIGLLDARSRSRRFTSYVGSDVTEGLPTSQSQTKTQTHIAASGFLEGARYSIAASLKGRIWSHRTAYGLKQWIDWCDVVGPKIMDNSISIDDVMAGFIRPEPIETWPSERALSLELHSDLSTALEDATLVFEGKEAPFTEVSFDLGNQIDDHDWTLTVRAEEWEVDYVVRLNTKGLFVLPADNARKVSVQRPRSTAELSSVILTYGVRVLLAGDALIEPPGLLLRPRRDLPSFPPDRLQPIDWGGIDIRRESWKGGDRPASVQGVMIQSLLGGEWDLLIDDDGSGEVADVVGLRRIDDTLRIGLVHCKFSSEELPGARVEDLYDVVGQAQKSAAHRRDVEGMLKRLLRRERNRARNGRTGFIVGDFAGLQQMLEDCLVLRHVMVVTIAQPGLSASRVEPNQLELLASAETYLRETANASFEVICSP